MLPSDPTKKSVRAWKDVEEAKDWPLCQIIKSVVEHTCASWFSPNGPHSWLTRLYGSHSARYKRYDVRYLEVVAKFDWYTSHGIEIFPVEPEEHPGCFPG